MALGGRFVTLQSCAHDKSSPTMRDLVSCLHLFLAEMRSTAFNIDIWFALRLRRARVGHQVDESDTPGRVETLS